MHRVKSQSFGGPPQGRLRLEHRKLMQYLQYENCEPGTLCPVDLVLVTDDGAKQERDYALDTAIRQDNIQSLVRSICHHLRVAAQRDSF